MFLKVSQILPAPRQPQQIEVPLKPGYIGGPRGLKSARYERKQMAARAGGGDRKDLINTSKREGVREEESEEKGQSLGRAEFIF